MSVEEVERIMDETQEAVEYQKVRVSVLLSHNRSDWECNVIYTVHIILPNMRDIC